MDLARAPRRAPLTARKKGSGYENDSISVPKTGVLPSSSPGPRSGGPHSGPPERGPGDEDGVLRTVNGAGSLWCGHVSHDHVLYSAGVARVA